MTEIRIEKITDEYECDDCGPSWAEGAKVYFDGALAFELTPVAHCYDGEHHNEDDIYKRVIEHLGHSVTIVESDNPLACI